MSPDPLTELQRAVVDELIVEAQKLAVTSDNFAETIRPKGAEQHAEALISQARSVRSIIARLPQPTAVWDGGLYDEHLKVEKLPVPARTSGNQLVGAAITHSITGIGRESTTKPTFEENLAVARSALEAAVRKRYERDYAGRI